MEIMIQKLLAYVDVAATKCLAEAHNLTQETLQLESVWHNNLFSNHKP